MSRRLLGFTAFVVTCGMTTLYGQQPASLSWWKPSPGSRVQIMAEKDGDYVTQLKPGTQIAVIEGILPDYQQLKDQVAALHARRIRVICYQSLSVEDWRADIDRFPKSAIGKAMEGWEGEWWTDTRPNSPAHSFWDQRYERLAWAGCDCVEDDNSVDPKDNESGFPLTRAEAAGAVARRARKAHELGMCHIVKNNPSMSAEYAKVSDGVHIEEAGQFHQREAYLPWRAAGKYGLMIEYQKRYCRPYEGFTVHYHPNGDYFDGVNFVRCG